VRNRFIEDLLKKTRQKRLLKRVIAGLSVIVIFVTFNTFKYNAMTLERTSMCGYEDHEHGPECFDAEGGLICELHAHTDACFQEAPRADLSLDAMMAGGRLTTSPPTTRRRICPTRPRPMRIPPTRCATARSWWASSIPST